MCFQLVFNIQELLAPRKNVRGCSAQRADEVNKQSLMQ